MKSYLYGDLYYLEQKHWWHISKRRIIRNIIQKYKKSRNLKILDVGCGTGKNMEELQDFGIVHGIDNSLEALTYCKKEV